MSQSLVKYIVIFALSAVACNVEEQPPLQTQAAPGSMTGDPSVVHHPEPPPRPQQKPDSIQIEGMWERFTATLVESTSDPRFSSYLAPNMLYEPASSGEGEGHYFYTNFGGRRNDEAYLLVFVYPRGTTEAQARARVNAVAVSRTPVQRSEEAGSRYSNSLLERDFQFQRNGIFYQGDVILGKHDDRFFHLVRQHPEDYSEGFWPRVLYIQREWVWLPGGQGLGLISRSPHE